MTESAVNENLGDRIARLRRAKGWNQRELGERIGTNGAQISKYERGDYLPRLDLLSRMGEAFNVSLDYLMTGRREPQRDLRLRERLEALETLPGPQRDNLIAFLDALLAAHQVLRRQREQQPSRVHKKTAPVRRG
jgi:transcriptional regulator with XRE-family HTH domain